MASISSGLIPFSLIRYAILCVRTVVFPVPAPAAPTPPPRETEAERNARIIELPVIKEAVRIFDGSVSEIKHKPD